jgi:demethylmenaquinone methyltransferase/2-methoxy-6-polyprenyl-1,4-benzoquinol methylase
VEPIRPHSELARHYGADGAREGYVRGLFDEAAPHYEWINAVMSLGSGVWYRRWALVRAGLLPGARVLDIASGTGLLARAAAAIVGPGGGVVGLDPSPGMLHEQRAASNLRLVRGVGERLPFRSGGFDFVSLGYGLRHVADLRALFGECRRVLRPGGRLLILEFAPARPGIAGRLGRLYLEAIVPAVARLATRNAGAERVMRYCWDTVAEAVSPQTVLAAAGESGFADVEASRVGGLFVEYAGRTPAAFQPAGEAPAGRDQRP